ncbi:MAG: hypothetical protein LBO00_00415 [Zoogloeaceae bacterium]|nr:hypothetical protein [Zoogloeaceae bacterium]
MSAPVTVVYELALAAWLVEELAGLAQEKLAEFESIREAARQREEARQAQRQAWREAARARLAGFSAQVEGLERRVTRLSGLLGREVILPPAPPHGATPSDWGAHVRALEQLAFALEHDFFQNPEEGAEVRKALDAVEEAPDLQHVMALYLAQRAMARGQAEAAAWRENVARVLSRLRLPEGAALPGHLEALARAAILAESRDRAELLLDELRLGVQRHIEEERLRQEEICLADEWLARLPEGVLPDETTALLVEITAGLRRLDAQSRAEIEVRVAAFEQEAAERAQRAAVRVLEASLQDLGYVVEPIAETLFTEGGKLHFQRPGWAEYQVRLKVDPKERHINFNVVRARLEDADAENSATRRQLDFQAEDRWCAEFPKLLQTLEARGICSRIIRRLEAGSLPVQVLAPEALPDFTAEEATARPAPRRRTLPHP